MKEQSEVQPQPNDTPLTGAGVGYSVSTLLPVLLSFFVSTLAALLYGEGFSGTQLYIYLAYLIPQISLFCALVLFLRRSGTEKKQLLRTCRIRDCKPYYFLVAIVLQFGLLFSLSYLNTLFVTLLERSGYHATTSPLPDLTGWRILPALFVIALLPAVFEEAIFRGMLTQSMRKSGWGTAATVLISGALFSLYHGNPQQTLYQFACGACFSLLALRSESILPTALAHFLNNAAILILTACGADLTAVTGAAAVILYVSSAVCLVGSLAFLLLYRCSALPKGGMKGGRFFFLGAAVGILICIFEWISVLITGFQGA